MKKSIVFVLVAAFAIAGFAAGDANLSFACDKAKSAAAAKSASSGCCPTATAATASADCDEACAAVAKTVTAGKNACCVAAVDAAMKACAHTAGASGCSKATATTADAKTASLHDCCKETVAAFEAAVSKELRSKTSLAWTSSSCAGKSATAGTVAGSGCTRSANAAAVAGSGCSKSANSAAVADAGSGCSKSANSAAVADAGGSCSHSKAALSYAEVKVPEGKTVVLVGNPACAKCTFSASESCEALFQTADGKVYRVLRNDNYKKMREAEAEKGFEVTTRVRNVDGVIYLEVETLKAL